MYSLTYKTYKMYPKSRNIKNISQRIRSARKIAKSLRSRKGKLPHVQVVEPDFSRDLVCKWNMVSRRTGQRYFYEWYN